MRLPASVREFLSKKGKKGGKVRSAAKKKAAQKNAALAIKKRWKKRR